MGSPAIWDVKMRSSEKKRLKNTALTLTEQGHFLYGLEGSSHPLNGTRSSYRHNSTRLGMVETGENKGQQVLEALPATKPPQTPQEVDKMEGPERRAAGQTQQGLQLSQVISHLRALWAARPFFIQGSRNKMPPFHSMLRSLPQ